MTARSGRALPQICCGRRRRSIAINGSRELEFTFCSVCESIQWFSGGIPVDRVDATAMAGVIAKETRGARRRTAMGRTAAR